MLEGQLAFAHIGEAGFIDQGIRDGPSMAGVELLIPRPHIGAKSRNVRSGSLKIIKRSKIRVISKVVVEAESLPGVDVMVEPEGELILRVSTGRHGLIGDAVSPIRSRNESEHIDCDR